MFGLPSPALIVGGILLTLLIASGALNACQHRENGHLRDQKATLTANLQTATDANDSQSKAITSLENANNLWAKSCTTSVEIVAQAAAATGYRARVESLSGELAKVKAHASADCQTLLATDLGALCGPVSDLLRERANGGGEGAHGGSQSPGGATAAGESHP